MSRVPGPLVTLVRALTREGTLDGVGGAQVLPVLGRVVEEGQQRLSVVGDLGDRLGPLDAVLGGERLDRCPCVVEVLGQDDLV